MIDRMKQPMEKIVPIVLCIVFPVLNAVTTKGVERIEEINGTVILRWLAVSLMLYLLWHLLAFFSEKAEKNKWIKAGIAVVVFLIIAYNLFLLTPLFQNKDFKLMFVFKYFLAVIPFLIIQYGFRAAKKVAQLELEKQQIRTENYKVQLDALRSKVEPHFLFNSLNTLRTMIRHGNPKSEQFVLSLSDFYRQTLKYNETTLMKLEDEVKVLESYLFLMKNRNENAVQVEISIPEEYCERLIPTLALQTVIENCFKHNMATSKKPLKIKVEGAEDFRIQVSNNLQKKWISGMTATGYGLENLRKRYEIIGGTDGVEVLPGEDRFVVRLKLL